MAADDPYTVQKGDGGWYQVAQKLTRERGYRIGWQELQRLNPQFVRPGGLLWGNGTEILRLPPAPGAPLREHFKSGPAVDTLPTRTVLIQQVYLRFGFASADGSLTTMPSNANDWSLVRETYGVLAPGPMMNARMDPVYTGPIIRPMPIPKGGSPRDMIVDYLVISYSYPVSTDPAAGPPFELPFFWIQVETLYNKGTKRFLPPRAVNVVPD
jgi:hypothetical protein